MAKPNFGFQKRQKELEKKRKQEEKRLKKLEKKDPGAPATDEATADGTEPASTDQPTS